MIPSKEQFRALVNELRSGPSFNGRSSRHVEFLLTQVVASGEARGVRWRDINEKLGSLLITGGETGTKNHEARTIPLFAPSGATRSMMQAGSRFYQSDDALIFEIENARLQIIRACERLKLPRFGHHTMRHFFCSNAIEAGCDFKVIADWLGIKMGVFWSQ